MTHTLAVGRFNDWPPDAYCSGVIHRPLPRRSLLKVPHQVRAIETVHALLDAALRVLERERAEAFSTARVATAAGVGPGTLYQYFPNRELLLAAVLEREMLEEEQLVRRVLAAPRQEAPEVLLGDVIEALIARLEPQAEVLSRITALSPGQVADAVSDVLEPRVMDAIRERLVRDPNHSSLLADSPKLYVAINGALFVLFKWLTDRPAQVSRRELVAALAAQTLGLLAPDDAGPLPSPHL